MIEVRLFSDRLDPEFVWKYEFLAEAFKAVDRELSRGGPCYCATIHEPGIFIVRYWNGSEILDVPGPLYLTRNQASRLHTVRGHLHGLPREFARGQLLIGLSLWVASILLITMLPFLVKLSFQHGRTERSFQELRALYLAEGGIDMAVFQLNETGNLGDPPPGVIVALGPVSAELTRFLVCGATVPFHGRPVRKIVRVVLEQFMIAGGLPRWKVISWQELGGTS